MLCSALKDGAFASRRYALGLGTATRCGFDQDLAAEATRTSNRIGGLLTQFHPSLARRDVREMPEPGEAVVVRQQELPAPHGAVVAMTRAVEGDADYRPGAVRSMLGHRSGDVGVMVLDARDGPVRSRRLRHTAVPRAYGDGS
jgi:hypothetical protein